MPASQFGVKGFGCLMSVANIAEVPKVITSTRQKQVRELFSMTPGSSFLKCIARWRWNRSWTFRYIKSR